MEGADEHWSWAKGKGRSLHLGAEERGTKWVGVFGRKGAGRAFSSFHKQGQRGCGGSSACPAKEAKGRDLSEHRSLSVEQRVLLLALILLGEVERERPALPTGSCLFLSPQRASLSDMGHSSFPSHALNEEGELL